MTLFNFLSPLISMGSIPNIWYILTLLIEGIMYELVSYVYKLFTLITQLNFNSIYAIVGPLVEKVEAVIMVLLVFKLGLAFVSMLLNPEGAFAKGKELLINIIVTVALLTTYSFVFSLLNEIGMLVIGAPPGYDFPVISGLVNDSVDPDGGLINRFVFGKEGDMSAIGDMGEYMAYQVASLFIVNTTEENVLENTIKDDSGGYDFKKIHNLESEIDRKISYFPLIGAIMAGYLVYVFVKMSIDVGVRMFKLLVLQLLAPLAIVTVITEGVGKRGFTGTMSNFIKTYLGVFAELFVRVLFTLIVTVFISKFIMNIGAFFGDINLDGETWITKALLICVIMFAGYQFVLKIPDLIKEVFGNKFSMSGTASFDKYAMGLVGGATGLVTGAVGGAMAGGNAGSRITGALAGGFAGAGGGFMTGSKGQNAVEAVKNSYNQTQKRNQDWRDRGGFGNVVVGAGNDVIGRTKLQDRKMNKYQEQMDAVDAYDKASTEYKDSVNRAQIDAVKGTHMDGSEMLDMRGYGDEAGQTVQRRADQIYSDGYENIHLGESAEGYAQKMIEYDKEYQAAKANLAVAQNSGDKQQIANAQAELVSTRQYSEKRAQEYWNSKKNSVNPNVDKSKLDQAEKTAREKLGKKENEPLDVKEARRSIKEGQKKIQDTRGYKATHPQSNNGGGGGH